MTMRKMLDFVVINENDNIVIYGKRFMVMRIEVEFGKKLRFMVSCTDSYPANAFKEFEQNVEGLVKTSPGNGCDKYYSLNCDSEEEFEKFYNEIYN
jgi:hypothetical protein